MTHPTESVRGLKGRFWACLVAIGLTLGIVPLGSVALRPQTGEAQLSPSARKGETVAEVQLQTGIALTRAGHFRKAIPHFLAARGHVADEFAVEFNLALCYVALGQYQPAIRILDDLARLGPPRADVYNLLAQALLGSAQPGQALEAFEHSAALKPHSENVYLLMADTCMDHHDYRLGVKVVNQGLQEIPRSARLHYERAVFLSFLNRPGQAMNEFAAAARLAPGTAIAFMAAAQKALLAGEIPEAIHAARRGVQIDPSNHILLTILAEALIRAGATPGSPGFAEAQAAAERSVNEQPSDAEAQLALGDLDLMAGHWGEAIAHLEVARKLWPRNPSIYAHLAVAYRRRGETEQAKNMLAILSSLNQKQVEQYRTASPAHKAGYTGLIDEPSPRSIQH
jgi:tetratricopeptide (TPR) repeat protein